jgi:hypothetical protein
MMALTAASKEPAARGHYRHDIDEFASIERLADDTNRCDIDFMRLAAQHPGRTSPSARRHRDLLRR